MCEPVTIGALTIGLSEAMAGMAVASTVAGAVGARKQAKGQMASSATQRKAQGEEISGKAGRSMGERVKQGRAERSRLRVAAGESGVAGQSFEAQMMDSAFQEDEDLAMIGKNAGYEQRGSEARFQSSLAQVNNPSALETGLQIAGAGASAWNTIQDRKLAIPTSEEES